jgi:hypothetical protein
MFEKPKGKRNSLRNPAASPEIVSTSLSGAVTAVLPKHGKSF